MYADAGILVVSRRNRSSRPGSQNEGQQAKNNSGEFTNNKGVNENHVSVMSKRTRDHAKLAIIIPCSYVLRESQLRVKSNLKLN